MRFYWGRSEARITGLTLKIMGVNAAALVMLLVGVVYLGQYQRGLIEAKLETFRAEVQLVAAALSEGAVEESDIPAWQVTEDNHNIYSLSAAAARRMVHRFGYATGQRIYIFDAEGKLVADSQRLNGPGGVVEMIGLGPPRRVLQSVETLKKMAGLLLKFLPDRQTLPLYPETDSENAEDYLDAALALQGQTSISAWHNKDEHIFLSAAAPLEKGGVIIGSALLTRRGQDIEQDIESVWLNILKVFAATLVITVFLSIYLSGVIARPLRRLARAAELVRIGKSKSTEIPDLSDRHDEIGELSIALREMTDALWDRMDAIESFAADVAHELKNPLTSLRSALETLAVVKSKKDKDQLMEIILHDLERLDRLISDISSASKLDAELSRKALQRVNLKQVLNDFMDAYKDPLEREKSSDSNAQSNMVLINNVPIELVFESRETIYVPGLDSRLTQVFENLIFNAVSFSPEGGSVTIQVFSLPKQAVIQVEDQGPGIPENKLETIFERFYSERPGHEAYGQHSGLGLSICKQIVTALGGYIYAENIKDAEGRVKGARFSIILQKL